MKIFFRHDNIITQQNTNVVLHSFKKLLRNSYHPILFLISLIKLVGALYQLCHLENIRIVLIGCSFRNLHSSQIVRMPVTDYSAEERGASNTDSYQVFIKDSQGQ